MLFFRFISYNTAFPAPLHPPPGTAFPPPSLSPPCRLCPLPLAMLHLPHRPLPPSRLLRMPFPASSLSPPCRLCPCRLPCSVCHTVRPLLAAYSACPSLLRHVFRLLVFSPGLDFGGDGV